MSNPLICSPQEKPGIEAANCVEQLDYITYLVNRLHARRLRESQILELHRLCVQRLYPCGGRYRTALHEMEIRNSGHTPPRAASVRFLVSEMVDLVNADQWEDDALERAAYALWRFNWIHPFAGGNGRTSRAIAYLVICMDWGVMLPGHETMPTILAERRDDYLDALQAADRGEAHGKPDLAPLRELLWEAAAQQVAPVARKLARQLQWEALWQQQRRRAARKERHATRRRRRRHRLGKRRPRS